MSEIYTYRTRARWAGERSGELRADGGAPILAFSAPPEFHGEEGKWSPELLLAGAAAGCFLTTFAAIAEFSKLEFAGLEVASDARLERVPGQGYRFTEILLRPDLTIWREGDEEKAKRLLEKAEKSCFVSRALQVPVRLEATVQVERPARSA